MLKLSAKLPKLNKYRKILKQYWGYDSFRPLQEEIILSVAKDKKDTLGLLPTGGGKSVIFQVPTMAHEGMALVVTPLIALMKDQVENLRKLNIPATAIYTGMTKDEIALELDRCTQGLYKFLYLSPERLSTEIFKMKLQGMNINFLVVDEAHCISQWGYDFRPSYLNIAQVRELIPEVPVLALTASATPEVIDDIQDKLGFKEKNVFKKSFERKNLVYYVQKTNDKLGNLIRLTKSIKGSGIVYVRSRLRTEEIADFLNKNGISADFYHAGLSPSAKDKKQNEWKHNRTRIIVATNAFGMGIDKPDVRFVIHIDLPDSLEAYYQEAGRGGRDGAEAYAVVLYNGQDIDRLRSSVEISFPPKETIQKVYSAVCNYLQIPIGSGKEQSYPFNMQEFSMRFKIPPRTTYNSLKILQQEGYLDFTEEIYVPSKLHITAERNDLYKFQVENPPFDPIIKAILRQYEGVFTRFVNINEYQLARKFKTDVKTIRKILFRLKQFGLIEYRPTMKSHFIFFPHGRIAEKNIILTKEKYHFLKQRYIDHIESVISYVERSDRCRSRLILEYFGEEKTENCGKCDVCRNHQLEQQLSGYFAPVEERLKKAPASSEELVRELKITPQQINFILKKLYNDEIIIFDPVTRKFKHKDYGEK